MTERKVWRAIEKKLKYFVVVIFRSFFLLHVKLLMLRLNWFNAEDVIKYIERLYSLLLLGLRWLISKYVVQYVERLFCLFFLVIVYFGILLRWVFILAFVLGLILLVAAVKDLVEG